MSGEGITARLARLIAGSAPERDTRAMAAARAGLLDFLACALAGRSDPGARVLWEAAGADWESPVAVVPGWERRTGPLTAALMTGYLGHALDYDDVHEGVRGHPSTVILPALLAQAQCSPCSARQLLAAYVVGVEAMCRLAFLLGPRHYELGWHSTATLGCLAAAAACAHLMRLGPEAVARALGLAATQAAGLRVHFGSQAKPLHAGMAARAGLLAARLAAGGMTAGAEALGGPLGFLELYGGGAARPDREVEGWGDPWQIADPGLWFKRYPCCSAAHHAADAALDLRQAHGIAPEEVEAITVTFPPGGDAALTIRQPRSGDEGRFSVEYVVAAALVDGELTLETFAGESIRPEVASTMEKVTRRYERLEPAPEAVPRGRFTIVTVVTKGGAAYSRRVDCPRGAPGRPLTAAELAAKFRDAACGGPDRWAEVPDLVARAETESDLTRLLSILQGGD